MWRHSKIYGVSSLGPQEPSITLQPFPLLTPCPGPGWHLLLPPLPSGWCQAHCLWVSIACVHTEHTSTRSHMHTTWHTGAASHRQAGQVQPTSLCSCTQDLAHPASAGTPDGDTLRDGAVAAHGSFLSVRQPESPRELAEVSAPGRRKVGASSPWAGWGWFPKPFRGP